ncbi:hypothetical protein FGO68_gene7215 [Halteria grandinella]|uniref:Uncharacterized protein n=1 Tax=Halteria grandinella TaxID=5974 RepID=A0A8J8P2R1_HALGN|nr:hypothetical protein FGO68_gene7215 [Halteria grandinella]
MVQDEFVTSKYIFENTNENLSEEYLETQDLGQGVEWNAYYDSKKPPVPSIEWSKFTWYAFPYANGSTPFYTLNKRQERDIQYCRNSFYFHRTVVNNPQLLIPYDNYYMGFESGIFCLFPAVNSSLARTTVATPSVVYCYCDSLKNCYFNPVCRAYFKSSKAHPDQIYFEDLYLFGGGNAFGLGVCSPVHGAKGEDDEGRFIGSICANVVPSYIEGRTGSEKGNYIKFMYLSQTKKANYVIADNQDIVRENCLFINSPIQWSAKWDPKGFGNYVWSIIDFKQQSPIADFEVRYEFKERSIKLAYFGWNQTKYAMMMQNFSVHLQEFPERSPDIYKSYTLGVMFESSIIDEKIASTQKKFYTTFLVLFLIPFLCMVAVFLICEIIFIVIFTRRIFTTINDLFDKIDMLNKQHRNALKRKKITTSNKSVRSYETLKTQEQYEDSTDDLSLSRRLSTKSLSDLVQTEEQSSKVDVLQDYQGRESCMEVTKLYRAANKLIKTLSLAKSSIMQGNANTALLSFNEVAHLFLERNIAEAAAKKSNQKVSMSKQFSNELLDESSILEASTMQKKADLSELGLSSNLSTCYNNIACIHAKKHNFFKQGLYFSESIRIEELIIKNNNRLKNFTSLEENFKLACKYFNYGYALYKQSLYCQKRAREGNFGFYYGLEQLRVQALESLKRSSLCFKIQEQHQLEKAAQMRERGQYHLSSPTHKHGPHHHQRSLKDLGLFIRVIFYSLQYLYSW